MRFVKVDEIPKNTYEQYRMRNLLEEFMNMNTKQVKVEDHGYSNTKYAYSAFQRASKRWAYPVDVHMHSGEVYLIRRDM